MYITFKAQREDGRCCITLDGDYGFVMDLLDDLTTEYGRPSALRKATAEGFKMHCPYMRITEGEKVATDDESTSD